MALLGAYENKKTRRLARLLQMPPWAALGMMEALWHWAKKSARTGRIEADQWEDLTEYLQWQKPPDDLRKLLIKAGLIEPMGGWDWVHDWDQHADDTLRKALERHDEKFANGSEPRKWRNTDIERKVPRQLDKTHGSKKSPQPDEKATDSAVWQKSEVPRNSDSGESSHLRAGPEPEPEPEPSEQIPESSSASRRRRNEEKQNPENPGSPRAKAAEPEQAFFSPDDDDEKRIAENPKLFLVALMQKSMGFQPDGDLLRDIETAVMARGATIPQYIRDVRPRITRLRAPPGPGFFLTQAEKIGETAEAVVSKNRVKEAIVAAKVLAMRPPKSDVKPTPGCGCIGGVLTVDGKAKYCDCGLGVNLQHGKRNHS